MSKIFNKTLRKILIAVTFLFVSPGVPTAGAQESVGVALNKCAGIDDDSARLSCYDALATVPVDGQNNVGVADDNDVGATGATGAAGSAADTTAVTAVVADTTAVIAVVEEAADPVPLTDEVGKERLEATPDEEQPKFSANVIACTKSVHSGQYYFTFENGQVWKQSNYSNLNLRDCEFDVEISKSAFGYKMYIPSKERTVRIARVK